MLLSLLAALVAADLPKAEASVAVLSFESGLCGPRGRASVVGLVFDDHGRPISAQISADLGTAEAGALLTSDTGTVAETDARGRFEFSFKNTRKNTVRWLWVKIGGFAAEPINLRLGLGVPACVLIRVSGPSTRPAFDGGME